MTNTRRAQHEWLRGVAHDLRAGRISRASEVLRDHGAIREFETHNEAREALVRMYVASIRSGRSALLIATSNEDVSAMNRQARELLRNELGEERNYTTSFGDLAIAKNDLVIARQRCGDSVNGDSFRVRAHGVDGTIARTHGGLQHGYARTSHRAQGRSVDDIFSLAALDRIGLYVDVTRARSRVVVAYGRDKIRDFGAYMANVQRTFVKTLVRDVLGFVEHFKVQDKPRRPIDQRSPETTLLQPERQSNVRGTIDRDAKLVKRAERFEESDMATNSEVQQEDREATLREERQRAEAAQQLQAELDQQSLAARERWQAWGAEIPPVTGAQIRERLEQRSLDLEVEASRYEKEGRDMGFEPPVKGPVPYEPEF
jgi:hypothetical protein